MIVFPNAKINLGLHVIDKRPDGFHNIETLLYPVPLYDALEIAEAPFEAREKISFIAEGLAIPGPEKDNLVTKAYRLLDREFNLPPVIGYLLKKIPMGAGLGGGSADAAFMLTLLNEKFNLNLSDTRLKMYASELGSDCAFFIENKPSFVYGKGHELEHVDLDMRSLFLVMVDPGIPSSTALAYKHVVVRNKKVDQMPLKEAIKQPYSEWKHLLRNDFEETVFTRMPVLKTIKDQLYQCGAVFASMSGSGSCIFGLFESKPNLKCLRNGALCYHGKASSDW